MSTSYERGLKLDGLTFDELMALKRVRQAELNQLHGASYELQDQLDRIQDALTRLKR